MVGNQICLLIALKLLSQVKAKSIQVKEAMDHENRTVVISFFFFFLLCSYKGGEFFQNQLFILPLLSHIKCRIWWLSSSPKRDIVLLFYVLSTRTHSQQGFSAGTICHKNPFWWKLQLTAKLGSKASQPGEGEGQTRARNDGLADPNSS